VSNVSSSIPAAIRFLLELDWFVGADTTAFPSDVASPADVVELDTAAPPPAVDELSLEDCILLSLAQPATIRLKKVIKSVFPSIGTSLINWAACFTRFFSRIRSCLFYERGGAAAIWYHPWFILPPWKQRWLTSFPPALRMG
jgi:hypothetical protein